MATPVRSFQKDSFYHVYNRGNRKQPIFYEQADYLFFLDKLGEKCRQYDIQIIAYCLMKNHYHLLLKQDGEHPVTKAMLPASVSYVKWFNKKYQFVGRLFQERFRAKLIPNDPYLLHVSRYIHLNPAEFTDFSTYPWSSYQNYIIDQPGVANPQPVLDVLSEYGGTYQKFVLAGLTPGVDQLSTPGVPFGG